MPEAIKEPETTEANSWTSLYELKFIARFKDLESGSEKGPLPGIIYVETIESISTETKIRAGTKIFNRPTFVVLLCPCGCESIIRLPLVAGGDSRKIWSLTDPNPACPTISPEVYQFQRCRTNFRISKGVAERIEQG